MRSGIVGLVLASGCLPSCQAHQELVAPSSAASVGEREAAYEQLRPTSYHETHITYVSGWTPVGTEKRVDYLQLADGRRVYYPEDILPVVPKDSPAALAAESSETARTTSTTLRVLGGAGWVVGGVLIMAPLFSPPEPGETMNFTPMYAGLAVAGVGTILYLVGSGFSGPANDEAATAFEMYDAGLREQLGICSPTDRSPACVSRETRHAEKPSSGEPSGTQPTAKSAALVTLAPEGVAGFRFGTDQTRAREVCENSEHRFEATAEVATCSGMAANLGVPGRASMAFCGGKLCEIEVTLETDTESYSRVLAALRKQLANRYGAPAQASIRSRECRGGLKNCVLDTWHWSSGHSVILTTGSVNAKPAILLTYSTPEHPDTNSPGPAL